MPSILVDSPNVTYTPDAILSRFSYPSSTVRRDPLSGALTVCPSSTDYTFRLERKIPKLGLMLVGWGGNNGSTVTAAVLANKHKISWRTKDGLQNPNYFGSIVQSSPVRLGVLEGTTEEVYVPFKDVLPMVNPNDLVIGGWDISSADLASAMERAKVLPWELQSKLAPEMSQMKPLPSIYYPDFIAANQAERADNLIKKRSKQEHLDHIREDIRRFKADHQLDSIVVVWTANTERFAQVIDGVNDTADALLNSISRGDGHEEISPSTIFAVACILESTPFVNGSPQNTFVPGVIELAERFNVPIGGDDFKSGQTKLKSVLVDFMVNAGIKPLSITSYNHLGNNDGKNLSAPQQFRSKEISKSNVVDDMVQASTGILYEEGEHPDHVVVIKYTPAVGDSKRAMDEYYSEIFMGGRQTIAIHNTCEDSLLASPLILDLAILAELMTRIRFIRQGEEALGFQSFHPVLSILSYLLKAPAVPPGTPVINSLYRQRAGLENLLLAILSLPSHNDLMLENRTRRGMPSSPKYHCNGVNH